MIRIGRRITVLAMLTLLISAGTSSANICSYSLAGDLNADCKVDLADVSMMAANWMVDCNQLPLNSACIDYMLLEQEALFNRQKGQFQSIEVGLEMFRCDFGAYPSSTDNQAVSFPPDLGSDPNTYLGANKLAEALVGMDLMGFHPYSDFRSDGLGMTIYGVAQTYTAAPENITQRHGPFVDVDTSNAYRLADIFEDTGAFDGSTLVLCDVFEKTRHSGRRTGMPILYFRARTNYTLQDCTDGIENDIYYYPDNKAMLELGSAENQTIQHPLSDGVDDWQDFENMILNPNIIVIPRPFRANSFILVSAGPDGLYGTPDDIFNFELN